MEAGSSTIGACGDVSRNVMCSPAPFKTPEYEYARQYSKVLLLPLLSNSITNITTITTTTTGNGRAIQASSTSTNRDMEW